MVIGSKGRRQEGGAHRTVWTSCQSVPRLQCGYLPHPGGPISLTQTLSPELDLPPWLPRTEGAEGIGHWSTTGLAMEGIWGSW